MKKWANQPKENRQTKTKYVNRNKPIFMSKLCCETRKNEHFSPMGIKGGKTIKNIETLNKIC